MKSLKEQVNESTVNESVGTIALGVAAAILGLGVLKLLVKVPLIGLSAVMIKKSQEELGEIQLRMAEILKKYPEALNNSAIKGAVSVRPSEMEYTFKEENKWTDLQVILSMENWDEVDRKEFMDLFTRAKKVWKRINLVND